MKYDVVPFCKCIDLLIQWLMHALDQNDFQIVTPRG